MNFDRLAPHYRWIEAIAAGQKLQRTRTAFLEKISAPRRALIFGEGNGRFLAEFLQRFPNANVMSIDASEKMLALAQRRLRRENLDARKIEFIQADALTWTPPNSKFDLIVTHFFLDCFRADQLELLVKKISVSATPDATWLLADFQIPAGGLSRSRARIILWMLYFFFRAATRLPASELVCPDPMLERVGFQLRERKIFDWDLLHSDLWRRC
jgi:ubiquinone/menaquinone biosynthesis C-methylase UbiE